MKWIAGIALLLALAACGGNTQWSKDGASPDTAAKDLSECQGVAQEATQRDTNINTDILASRGHDWGETGALTPHQETYAAQDQDQTGDIVTRCMIAKGYAPGA